jgi:hypothetical protein
MKRTSAQAAATWSPCTSKLMIGFVRGPVSAADSMARLNAVDTVGTGTHTHTHTHTQGDRHRQGADGQLHMVAGAWPRIQDASLRVCAELLSWRLPLRTIAEHHSVPWQPLLDISINADEQDTV